jgi:bla regulator protein blaR1
VKFLVPFSLLVGLGMHMPHRAAGPAIRTEWVAAFQEWSQPLVPPAAERAAVTVRPVDHVDVAAAAAVLWACGFAAVAICWLRRWRRMHALRNAARTVSIPTSLLIPVPVLAAPDLIEPGVAGIFRPVLLLPEGITERLNQTQLDAILAHEFSHVRRRDNLMAAIHMAVQAIFWFHPLTWWIGARLVDERERACDEEVLRRGCKPNAYAESILLICRWYLASPLACVSGVTGSNLKRRVEAIMRNRNVAGLNRAKKMVLAGAGVAALVVPIVVGALDAPAIRAQDSLDWQAKAGGKLTFEVASVKPSTEKQLGAFPVPLDAGDRYYPTGGYFRADVPLWSYIQFAYKLWFPAEDQLKEIARLPKWVTTDRYSIEARAAGKPSKDQFRLMVQSLLADRFRLAAHFETREAAVLALTPVKAGKLGPKLIPHADGRACGDPAAPIGSVPAGLIGGKYDAGPENYPPMCDSLALIRRANGTMLVGYRNATMDQVAGSLSGIIGLGHTLVDRTGLSGRFDFTLAWAPEPTAPPPSDAPTTSPDPLGPTPVQALRDQLGLKLEAARGPVKILVIDKVERPSEN